MPRPLTPSPDTIAMGTLTLAGITIPCAVVKLPNGQLERLLSLRSTYRVFGFGFKGRSLGDTKLAPFLAAENLSPFISHELRVIPNPESLLVPFRTKGGQALGYPAAILPLTCEVYLAAREAGLLRENQAPIAQRCERIMRALARVGILALIDEATGYQHEREADDLQRLVNLYLAHEPLPWRKTFVDDFYIQLHRVYGKPYDPALRHRGTWVARFTKRYLYDTVLPREAYTALCQRNPRTSEAHWTRRHAHHQLLTQEIGAPLLAARLTTVLHLLRQSANPAHFQRLFERGLPAGPGQQLRLVMPES